MAPDITEPIAHLHWNAFTQLLDERLSSGASDPELDNGLMRYFGEEGQRVRDLAAQAFRLRAALPSQGNVVFVHGTMCADLSVVDASGAEKLLWMSLPRLSAGDLEQLTLDPSGADRDPRMPVKAAGINKLAYAATLLWLSGRWNVKPFAYDWRKDLDGAADALAAFIHANFEGEPVHLLAHSLGGMVCRNFIRRHEQLWHDMRDTHLRRGGRLVMLGTPNYGTYLASQVMSGQSELVWALESMDLRHSREDILSIVDSFVANYQLLPAQSRIPASEQGLYQSEQWGSLPISGEHLKRSQDFQRELETPATIDPNRMRYVAGYGYETPTGVTLDSPGQLEHHFTLKGDGVTTLELGPLAGVPTWFAFANHLELACNPRILAAADDLLLHGSTLLLARKPMPLLTSRVPLPHSLYSLGRSWLDQGLRDVSRRVSRGEADVSEMHRAEQVLTRTILGERHFMQSLWQLEKPRVLDLVSQFSGGTEG